MATIGKAILQVNPKEKMPSYYVGQPFQINSLLSTLKWLCFNEAVHFFLILVCAIIGYIFFKKGYSSGVIIIILTVILNIGLILMQHMNRIRIKNVISLLKKREQNRNTEAL